MEELTPQKKAERAEKMLTALADVRRPFEAQIDEIIEYVQHSRRKITDKDAMKGQKTGIKVYDGTAISALNLLTDGLCGHTASKSLRWYGYALPGKWNFPRTSGMRGWSGKRMDEYQEVKEWLRDCEDVTYAAFLRSNFYGVIPDVIRDGASKGTATIIIEEDLASNRIIFTSPHFREIYIAENQFGQVDTHYRVYKLTLMQLADKFGLDTMKEADPNFQVSYDTNPYTEKEILHAVYPRDAYDSSKMNNTNFQFASEWYSRSPSASIGRPESRLISESGYEGMSHITWRWRKNNDEIYGRSPAWDAYIDIMKANQQGRSNLVAGHKMVEGPMVATEDMRGKVMTGPSGWTYVDRDLPADKWPRSLNEKINLPYAVDQQERTDKLIKEHFHVDFFLMLYQAAFNKVDLTATQVVGMQAEQAVILGARVGRLDFELYDPIHDRVFYIESRAGRIPDPPDILLSHMEEESSRGRRINIEIEHMGPLAQAQKRLFKQQSLNAGAEYLARMREIDPASIDRVDTDQAVIEGLDAVSWPANCLRTDEKVMQIRQLRQQKEEQIRSAQVLGEVAKASRHLGKTAESGSPMEAIKGQIEGEV